MAMEEDVQKLLAINEELKGTIKHYEEKYNLSKIELFGIYTAEQVIRNPEFLDTPLAIMKMEASGYLVGGLVSFCGGGSPHHICIEREKNGSDNIYFNYKPACNFIVFTPSLPKVNNEIKEGFIQCNSRFGREVKWGLIGKEDRLDKFCNESLKDHCVIRKFPSKITPASSDEIVKEFRKILERKNENFAKYSEEIFKHIHPIIREAFDRGDEIVMKLLDINQRTESRNLHYRV